MVRTYKRKRPRQWRDKDKRMAAAVRLRAEGKSLREIGRELAVSYQTVARDLAKWDREHANVVPIPRPPVTSGRHISPPRGQLVTPECDSADSGVISLTDRRRRA